MLNPNTDALGIIFPNSYDDLVPELVRERLMASIPFASRYRMIDFLLSSMVNSGIDNVSIIVRKNYHSLMDHLGSGREWDLARKNGGLSIFPPYAEKTVKLYSGRVEALMSILKFLKDQKEKYVILCDANIAVNFDFKAMLQYHIENNAEVTVAYQKAKVPAGYKKINDTKSDLYYTLSLGMGDDPDRINRIYMNIDTDKEENFGLNIYIINRDLLIDLIDGAAAQGMIYFERDVLAKRVEKYVMRGYCYDGYVARICDMKSYFDENLRLLDDANLDALFVNGSPIYTKIRDDNPTRYINGSKVKNVMAADGCIIEGEVENSVLFRGVKIGKGAVVRNCVLMQDTVVQPGAKIEYVITDKDAVISEGKEVHGTDTYQIYAAKGQVI